MLRNIEGGCLSRGAFHLVKVRTVVEWQYVHHGGSVWAHSSSPRLQAWGSQGGSYWTSRVSTRSGYGGHVWGFVPRGGGLSNQVKIHGDVSIITRVFDDSGSSIILSRKDIVNKCQVKALREGCYERK